MAKHRRKKSGKSGKRRRRMGAVSGSMNAFFMQAAGVAVADIVGGKIDQIITDYIDKSKDPEKLKKYAVYISAGGKIMGGYFLNKKVKNPFMQGLAFGLAGEGAGQIGKSVMKINGIFLNRPGVLGNDTETVTISGLIDGIQDDMGNDEMGANARIRRPDVLGAI